MSVNEKMTAIADAIRAKTGGTAALTLDQMAEEIAGIQGGGGSDGNYSYYNGFHGLYTKIVTAGANTVSNSQAAFDYFQAMMDGTLLLAFLMDDYGAVNNQLVGIYDNSTNRDTLRYRDGDLGWIPNGTATGSSTAISYDAKIVEGTKYLLAAIVKPTV